MMKTSFFSQFKIFLSKIDVYLVIAIFLLLIYGIVVIWSSNPILAQKQIFFAFIGLLLFFFISFLNPSIFSSATPYFLFVTLVLLVLTPLLGRMVRETERWLQIGSFSFQPSELAKLAIILGISWLYSHKELSDFKKFALSLFTVTLYAGVVFIQPDLGTSLILFFIWLVISFLSGTKFIYFFWLGIVMLIFLPVAWNFLAPYQRERLFSFLDPQADPLGSGYNVLQAMIAVGSGKLSGRGLGRGPQSQLRFLPERTTDFIFASLVEEWGLLGGVMLLGFFFLLLLRVLKVGYTAQTKIEALVCTGVFSMIFIQFLINVGMNVGIFPVTGIPLPLISAGGSSLIITLISLGIVQSISVHSN